MFGSLLFQNFFNSPVNQYYFMYGTTALVLDDRVCFGSDMFSVKRCIFRSLVLKTPLKYGNSVSKNSEI